MESFSNKDRSSNVSSIPLTERHEMARKLLSFNVLSFEQIASATKLSVKEIERIEVNKKISSLLEELAKKEYREGIEVALRKQIIFKFFKISDSAHSRLVQADIDQLLRWSINIFEAKTLNELLDY